MGCEGLAISTAFVIGAYDIWMQSPHQRDIGSLSVVSHHRVADILSVVCQSVTKFSSCCLCPKATQTNANRYGIPYRDIGIPIDYICIPQPE